MNTSPRKLDHYLYLPQRALQSVRLVEVIGIGVERIVKVFLAIGLEVTTSAVVVHEDFAVSVTLQEIENEQNHELEVSRWTRETHS